MYRKIIGLLNNNKTWCIDEKTYLNFFVIKTLTCSGKKIEGFYLIY